MTQELGTPRARTDGERLIMQLELSNMALVLVAVVITHLVAGEGRFLWGVIVGGVLGALNLRAMVFIGRRILIAQARSRAGWAVLLALKLALICTIVWLCLSYLPIHSLGFLVGFSTLLPASLVLTAIRALEAPRTDAPRTASVLAPGNPTSTSGERRL